jgi:hypothetical protein
MGIGVSQMKLETIMSMAMPSILVIVCGTCYYLDIKDPKCPYINPKDIGNSIRSKDIGSVDIEGETCHLVEVYEHECFTGSDYGCKGEKLICIDRVLSRLTKCPSGTVSNTVTRTGGKFPHEEVQ